MIVIIAVVVVAALGGVLVARRGRDNPKPATSSAPDASRSTIAPPAPMTGLESALDSVMDRSGRNMRQNLEAEAAIVDDLKVSDDTGPILRRALDRVEHAAPPTGDEPRPG